MWMSIVVGALICDCAVAVVIAVVAAVTVVVNVVVVAVVVVVHNRPPFHCYLPADS